MKERIRVGIVTPAFFYVPYWAATDKGWYAELGLDVEVIDLGGIDAVTKALKDSSIEVGVGSPEHVIHDVARGGKLRMVGGNVNRLTHSLIAQPEIKKLEDLRGKVIGVSALSGGTSSLFIDILERAGLQYPDDYSMIEAGPVPPRHEKLLKREIDACMQTDPHNYLAEDAGLTNLGAVAQWIPYFQFTSVNVDVDRGQRNPDALTRFLAASIRASRWMVDDKEGAIKLAQSKMGISERYARRAWDDHAELEAVPLDLHLDSRSIQTCIDMIRRDRSAKLAISADMSPQKVVDVSFLRDAQKLAGVAECLLA